MNEINDQLLNAVKQIKALAEAGLVYNSQNYDAERYEEMRTVSLEMMSILSNLSVKQFTDFYLPEIDYPTAKVDVRALITNDHNQVLLVKETLDEGVRRPNKNPNSQLSSTKQQRLNGLKNIGVIVE